jgi:hypothetical protein
MNSLLDDLIRECGTLRVPMAELGRGAEASGLSHEAFCDAFARRVALRYLEGSLDFDAADAAINNLHFFAFRPPESEPGPYMWSVYHAFDEGEHQQPGDSPDISPADRYTHPQLLAIVAGAAPE